MVPSAFRLPPLQPTPLVRMLAQSCSLLQASSSDASVEVGMKDSQEACAVCSWARICEITKKTRSLDQIDLRGYIIHKLAITVLHMGSAIAKTYDVFQHFRQIVWQQLWNHDLSSFDMNFSRQSPTRHILNLVSDS